MLRALWVTFALSAAGTVFSGTLAWRELFGAPAASCPSPGAAGTILGYPACIYGFAMFALIMIASGAGILAATRRRGRPVAQTPAYPG